MSYSGEPGQYSDRNNVYVAPVPQDTYQGGYSPSQPSQDDDFNNPTTTQPSWLQDPPLPQMDPQPPQQQQNQQPTPGFGNDQGYGQPSTSFCGRFGPKVLACLCYFFGIIGGVVGVVFEKKDAYVLANAWQSVFVGIPCCLICLCFSWISIVAIILWCAYAAVGIALAVCCIAVPYPRIFHLPCVGNWAIKRAQYTVLTHQHHVASETTSLRKEIFHTSEVRV